MKKTKFIIEGVILFSLLILIPFVISDNFNGTQNLCGDGYCQSWENASSCPADCINPQNDISPTHSSSNISLASVFSGMTLYIILAVVLLLIIGVIVYIIIKKKNNSSNTITNEAS